MPELTVSAPTGDAVPVKIWKDTCAGFDAGDTAAAWISQYLGQPARLVRKDPATPRAVDQAFAGAGDSVGFADGFPYLVTNNASLAALQPHFAASAGIGMDRFRPNIVLDGLDAFAEDRVHTVLIGGYLKMQFVKPCSRCIMTTIDQQSGLGSSQEPVATLSRLRRGKGDGLQGIFFGQNALVRDTGTIRVGDTVTILATAPAHPALQTVALKA